VIGGFTLPKNSRSYFGSLFLGVFDKKGNFKFCGNVGTGFTQESLKKIYTELEKRVVSKNPFNSPPPEFKSATWVKPDLVVEVEFREWTKGGQLRHPSFKALCQDKKAEKVSKAPNSCGDKQQKQPLSHPRGILSLFPEQKTLIKLTNPDKIIYEEDSISKQDLFNYYQAISSFILPYIVRRPLTLVRCPNHYHDCFYQKKIDEGSSTSIHSIEITHHQGSEKERYIYIEDEAGLLSLVQLGVLEIHPWGSQIDKLDYPDRIIFDLDPAPNVPWKAVVEAARDVKYYLAEYQLTSFVKTTGGKGLHVVVPIKPEYPWEEVKSFAKAFVEVLETIKPDKYISKISKTRRKGKIFIDYLRNQRGGTAVAAYSTRARIHAPVSTPLDWDELTFTKKDAYYTIATLPKRLKKLQQELWKTFWTTHQSLRLDKLK
jgi:bifunctional non-homologous end joining protein LigD